MPTVAEPFERIDPGAEPVAVDAAERSLMPGLAAPDCSTVDLATELLLSNLLARLQRVVTDFPGDRQFLRDMRGKRVAAMTDAQRAQVMRVAWRYRFQLPAALRPAADPDKPYPKVTK
jgi:hypothetical protein